MNINENKLATTVKIPFSLYDEFKILGIRNRITLQTLAEKSVFRYVNDELFRISMNDFNLPLSSSMIN